MATHDAYARLTPYEMLLPDAEFPDRHFQGIGEEAAARGVDTGNPAAFVMLGAVQGALAELRAEDAAPESANDHGSVLFFAYQLWRAGPEMALVRAATLRRLLTPPTDSRPTDSPPAGKAPSTPDDAWTNALRGRAGYVQLPQHLVWLEEGGDPGPGDPPSTEPAKPHPNEPAEGPGPQPGTTPAPESVDGFFWAADPGGIIQLALVSGVRGDRPGYGVVPVPPQPLATMTEWSSGPAREGGGDFTTSLPGAELDGLLGIRTPAEVFKLAALVLGLLVAERRAATAPAVPPAAGDPGPGGPPPGPAPTSLPSTLL